MNTREILKQQYGASVKWQKRVDGMSEQQVQAIYLRLLREGKLKV